MSDVYVIEGDAGSITVSSEALAQIVRTAVAQVDGARVRRARRGLDVDVDGGHARVELELAARQGTVLPELARDVQSRVAGALRGMCGLEITAVDVSIEEVA